MRQNFGGINGKCVDICCFIKYEAERNPWRMKISDNVSINVGKFKEEQQTGKFGAVSISGKKQETENENNEGILLNGQFDAVEQKKAFAQKQAYKIVTDALARELKMDANVQEYKDHAARLQADMDRAQAEIGKIDDRKEALRIDSGVEADSEEQKDLELLEKRAAYERGDLSKALTEEESERVKALDERGYTEYQKQALEMEKHKAPYETAVNKAQSGIISANAVIRGSRLERLKKDHIRKAQNEKDDMLAAASREVMGMLVDEAKDHMDEKSEEIKEKAEEKKAEKEEQKEELDAAKEKREKMEAFSGAENTPKENTSGSQPISAEKDPVTEAMVQLDTQRDDYRREIEEMMRKMNLLTEDMKGIKVDETF